MKRKDYCIECGKINEYTLKKEKVKRNIRGKDYEFEITNAYCNKCGEKMSVPGLIDYNVKEIDEQYREIENIIKIEEIMKLMHLYNIGKTPLSLVLGFGEITITRHLDGQVPSKEYSNTMKEALSSPKYMDLLLEKNKSKIKKSAYEKTKKETLKLMNQFNVSNKMLTVIAILFNELEEVTPLVLQKLLYFIQGLCVEKTGKYIFIEECEAWVHGPVYREVYNMFKDFKYNAIDDDRFSIINNTDNELSNDEIKVVKLVANTFGLYSGKVLEKITHCENPWKEARKGYGDKETSDKKITKKSIREYYETVGKEYDLRFEKGVNKYIKKMLRG